MFADDTTISFSDKDLESVLENFYLSINSLNDWCFYNKIDINWSKTFCMIFSNRTSKNPEMVNLCGNYIKVVKK